MTTAPKLYRIAVKAKETDKRKNATVWRYVVLATSLDEAKTLAVAQWADKSEAYYSKRLENVAKVWGHSMSTLAYNADIYGERDKSEDSATVPSLAAVREAQARLAAVEDEED